MVRKLLYIIAALLVCQLIANADSKPPLLVQAIPADYPVCVTIHSGPIQKALNAHPYAPKPGVA